MNINYRETSMRIIIYTLYFALGYLMATWRFQPKIEDLKLQLEKAPIEQTYTISATLEKFVRKCQYKEGGSFPVLTTEPYDEIRLRCFQFWKGDSGSWTELEMNPTFALPLEENK